jgi:hypothetical protein
MINWSWCFVLHLLESFDICVTKFLPYFHGIFLFDKCLENISELIKEYSLLQPLHKLGALNDVVKIGLIVYFCPKAVFGWWLFSRNNFMP